MPRTAAITEPAVVVLRRVEVIPVMARLVVVALVVVELPTLSAVIVDDALEMNPAVNCRSVEVELPIEVGVNGKMEESDEDDTLLLKVLQSAAARQPKVEASAVLQVTAPEAQARAPEKVVVAAA